MAMNTSTIENGKLIINKILIETPNNVVQSLQVGNIIVARLDGSYSNRNVIAYDLHGKQIWQVQESPHGGSGPKPFTDMWKIENKLYIANWHGVEYEVNIQSGLLTVSNFQK